MCVAGCLETVHRELSRRRFFKGAVAVPFLAAGLAPSEGKAATRQPRSVVDLSHALSPSFPTFDGGPGIDMQRIGDIPKNMYNIFRWSLVEHSGTHLDAPIHFSDAGHAVDAIPVQALVAPLAVIDVTAKAARNPDYQLSRDDLAAWERRHGRLPDHCCVAMHSGWGQYVTDAAKFTGKDAGGKLHFPGFASDAAEWLVKQRKVVGIASDTLSLDPGTSTDFKTHLAWLPTGRWGLECVANLDKVPATGATLVVGVAKVKDATGAPARLIALI